MVHTPASLANGIAAVLGDVREFQRETVEAGDAESLSLAAVELESMLRVHTKTVDGLKNAAIEVHETRELTALAH